MKTSTSDLRALLHGSTSAAFSDLITVTLKDTSVARWTTDTYDLIWDGQTYTASGSGTAPVVRRGRIREATGLEVSTMDLTLGCGQAGTATIGGVDLRRLAVSGGLDDARVSVKRAYMATPAGAVVGVVDRFSGVIVAPEADSNEVRCRVQSDLSRLEEQLPRHLIRDKCVWAFGDAGCGVDVPALAVTSTVTTSGTTSTFVGTNILRAGSGGTVPLFYFSGGTIRFTSGALAGRLATIKTDWNNGLPPFSFIKVELIVALPSVPANGDGITLTPGCDKTIATCRDVFSGGVTTAAPFVRRRGFDFVPPPDYVTR